MSRYVLRFSGQTASAEHVKRIRSARKLRVIDESPKMMLVEGDDKDVHAIADEVGWSAIPERSVPLPDPRPKVEAGPDDEPAEKAKE